MRCAGVNRLHRWPVAEFAVAAFTAGLLLAGFAVAAEPAGTAGPAQRYLDGQIHAVGDIQIQLDGLAAAADAAAGQLLAGGNLWLAGEPSMVAELAGRAGGLCGAKVLSDETAAAMLGRNDVVLWSDYGVTPRPAGIRSQLLQGSALVVAFSPKENAAVKRSLPEHVRWIEVKIPVPSGPAGGANSPPIDSIDYSDDGHSPVDLCRRIAGRGPPPSPPACRLPEHSSRPRYEAV